jgi:hypothetical protein
MIVSTPRICYFGDIGMSLKIIIVFYVQLISWRTRGIYFLIVSSAQESGTTFKFLGILVPLMNRWLDHENASMDLVFLKWLFWHVGAFGNNAMVIFSKEFGQVSEDGKPCSGTK